MDTGLGLPRLGLTLRWLDTFGLAWPGTALLGSAWLDLTRLGSDSLVLSPDPFPPTGRPPWPTSMVVLTPPPMRRMSSAHIHARPFPQAAMAALLSTPPATAWAAKHPPGCLSGLRTTRRAAPRPARSESATMFKAPSARRLHPPRPYAKASYSFSAFGSSRFSAGYRLSIVGALSAPLPCPPMLMMTRAAALGVPLRPPVHEYRLPHRETHICARPRAHTCTMSLAPPIVWTAVNICSYARRSRWPSMRPWERDGLLGGSDASS